MSFWKKKKQKETSRVTSVNEIHQINEKKSGDFDTRISTCFFRFLRCVKVIFTLRKKEKKVGFFSYQWRDAGRDLLKTSTGKSEISAPLSSSLPFTLSLSLTSLTPSSLSPSLLSPPLVLVEASPPCSPSGLRSLLGQVFSRTYS